MKLVLIGPAGSGKGSIAQRIGPLYGIPQIAMGDLLREEVANKTDIGREAEKYMNKGALVPNELTFKLLEKRIAQPDAAKGFILDGFPRNMDQARYLDKITKIDAVIYLNVPEDILIKRLSARVCCKKCNKIYNMLFLKPKVEGICDVCGGELYQRDDDKPEAIKKRLHEQWEQTKPVVEYYKKKKILKEVHITDINAPPEDNSNKVLEALGKSERLKLP